MSVQPTNDTLDDATDQVGTADEHGRRALLRKVAIGGAGAAVAAIAFDRTALAGDQAGTQINGNAVELGEANTATGRTAIAVTPAAPVAAGPSAFSVGAADPAAAAPFPAAVGGYGNPNYANGIHGSTTNGAGFGVVAANLAAAAADDTIAAPSGLAVASANGPQITFVALGAGVSGPTPGKHGPGEMYVDKDGTLWFTVPVPAVAPATTAGVRFVKLAGTETAGSFHALPVAKRVFDSRLGTSPSKLAEGATTPRDIDLTKDTSGAASGFPAGARLALLNLTIVDTEVAGNVALFAKGTPVADVTTSNINWTAPGASIANSTTVPVDATGSISAIVGGDRGDTATARTHMALDLVGYYL
jgi:hypothetical protein